ncbi:MAG: formylglycine-generating enzyme family protein, partial [Methanosarcinaceae archaeon]|nr:formylglycine-generating enzyme family protein [Methanosarcinaceae archaeon]
GTKTRYSFGDENSKLEEYAWYKQNAGEETHPVGQKKPNLWGLYDMHGNVWEWVQDPRHKNYEGAPSDGSVWKNGGIKNKMVRGGSWFDAANLCRSSSRTSKSPKSPQKRESDKPEEGYNLGFRLLREV